MIGKVLSISEAEDKVVIDFYEEQSNICIMQSVIPKNCIKQQIEIGDNINLEGENQYCCLELARFSHRNDGFDHDYRFRKPIIHGIEIHFCPFCGDKL